MPSQLRNYLLFFLSFILIYGGYFWARNYFWPSPKKLAPSEIAAIDNARHLIAANASSSADVARVAVAAAQATFTSDQAHEFIAAVQKEQSDKQAAAKPPEPVKPPPPPATPPDLITLGDRDDFHLKVVFTNRGAGVHSLTLTRFKAADWYGLPERDANKQPVPLELIPPSDTPSFALYHYERHDEPREKARPLDVLGKRDWQLVSKITDGDEQRVVYATDVPEFGIRLIKTFSLKPQEYHLGLTVKVERLPDAKTTVLFRYQLAGGHGLPIEGIWYTTIFRNALFYWTGAKDERNLFDSKSIAMKGGSDQFQRSQNCLEYAAVASQYFTSAIVVAEDQPKRNFIEFVRATVEADEFPQHQELADITVRTIAEAVEPKADAPVEHKYVLYHGPIKVRLLEQLAGGEGGVSPELTHRYESTLHLNTLTDFGGYGPWTNAIIFFTNVVHWLIGVLRKISPNDAICIILVTIIVRLVMLPLSRRQSASMAKTQEGMAKLKPELAKINERYKNDLVTKQQETMALYRKHGINPAAGLGGCLMLFLQMPIFLGLYFALQESFFFRLESFLWVRNLAAPDMLIWWTENVPFISERSALGSFFYLGPYFNLLPTVAMALMVFQMKYMQPPAADEQMAQQQKMMLYIMTPMMAFMFYKMPAGLCLYFIATTLWGLAERKWLIKKKPPAEPAPSGNGRPTRAGGGASRGRGKNQPEPGRLRAWWDRLLKEASKK